MRKTTLVLAFIVASFLALTQVHLAQTGGTIDLRWHVMSSGGATSSSGDTTLLGASLGQFAPGSASGATTGLHAGFWQAEAAPTAVELISFTAIPRDGGVVLTWETATEIDLLGFRLYRGADALDPETRLTEDLIRGQAPGSPGGAVYEFLDDTVAPGSAYWYWLEYIDTRGKATRHGPVPAVAAGAERWWLFLPFVMR